MNVPGDEDSSRSRLDPWRVILAYLFGIDSYEIPRVIDASGLAVEWRLTEQEDYNNGTAAPSEGSTLLLARHALFAYS